MPIEKEYFNRELFSVYVTQVSLNCATPENIFYEVGNVGWLGKTFHTFKFNGLKWHASVNA